MNISEAEREIARVLAALEKENDCIVDLVALRDIEVTTMGDDRQQLQRRVVIETHRIPGSNWSQ